MYLRWELLFKARLDSQGLSLLEFRRMRVDWIETLKDLWSLTRVEYTPILATNGFYDCQHVCLGSSATLRIGIEVENHNFLNGMEFKLHLRRHRLQM